MKSTLENIQKQFNITKTDINRDDLAYITIDQDKALALVAYMKESLGMKHLSLMSVVDYIERNVFQITYSLNNPDSNFIIAVRTEIDREKAEMDSAHLLWPTIATYQREIFEMFGINFPGSPGVDESLFLEGWEDKPPYRRDFDTLKYTEETFFPREGRSSNDPKAHMKKEIYGEWKKGEDNV